jgi:hypothetical protein
LRFDRDNLVFSFHLAAGRDGKDKHHMAARPSGGVKNGRAA